MRGDSQSNVRAQLSFFRRNNMTTSKKTSKKKAAKKGGKKSAATAKVRLDFPIDAERVEAIKRCLAKGTLRVTVSKADLGRARLRDPYLYD
jgi:anti-sigma28 factor (negative regulator of flagellin synthesis)